MCSAHILCRPILGGLPSRFYQACCRTPYKRKLGKSTVQRQSSACQTVLDTIGDLLADRLRALVGGTAWSGKPQRELAVWPGVPGDEVANMVRNRSAFDIAAGLNFERDIFRDVLRPMLKRIEGDNADRVVELSRHQIGDDGFEVGPLNFGLAVNGAQPAAKAVDDEVDGLIRAVGHERRGPACSRHTQLPQNATQHRGI